MRLNGLFAILLSLLVVTSTLAQDIPTAVRTEDTIVSVAGELAQSSEHQPPAIPDMRDDEDEDDESPVDLSGPAEIIETQHFRVHYTRSGADSVTDEYITLLALALEETWAIQIDQMGWPAPPPNPDGDGRYPVYVASLKDTEGVLMGYVRNEDIIGDNPNSGYVERWAAHSFMVIENDFAEMRSNGGDPIDLMRATVAHEFHHAIQFGYDAAEAHDWYYEATATWMEIETFGLGMSAIEYVQDNFQYPEICFGAPDVDGLSLEYGNWTFIQSLVDRHGDQIIMELWENIAEVEGFTALERTLERYGETLPEAVLLHHLQSLMRDYPSIDEISSSVWLTNTIRDTGSWEPEDLGIQELGANFFHLKRPPGTYHVQVTGGNDLLTLWAIGIHDGEADVIPLGNGGTIRTDPYEYVYVMVFNEDYDSKIDRCDYVDYALKVTAGADDSPLPILLLDATYFVPLVAR